MECPPPSKLIDFTAGGLDRGEADALEAHVDTCSLCRSALALIVEPSWLPPARPNEPLPPGTMVGRYRVEALIGSGAMGVVYAAHDTQLDRRVALKLVKADGAPLLRERLGREARVVAQVRDRHVVAIHDVGEWQGQLFLALELIDGPNLRGWLAAAGRSREQIVAVFIDAARGLNAIHRAGLVHRDFKPENLLLGSDGARVADLGLARSTAEPAEAVRGSAASGTPAYLAPEVKEGGPADPRSDQYAFSVTLYEALHGARPGTSHPERPVPARLRLAVARGLEREPSRRFESMEAFAAELSRSVRRRQWWPAVAAAVVALGVTGVAMKLSQPPCRGLAVELSSTWNGVQRERVRLAFEKTALAYAPKAFEAAASRLDDYAKAWVAARTDACEATRVKGTQSEELLDRRIACLDDRRRELSALVGALGEADGAAVERSVDAVGKLPVIASCADGTLLLSLPLPADPAARGATSELRAQVAKAREELNLGAFAAARADAEDATHRADALGFLPVQAAARTVLGIALDKLGKPAEALPMLEQAAAQADRGRDDEARAQALIATGRVAVTLGKLGEAAVWAQEARAAQERIGGSPQLNGDVLILEGIVAHNQGDYERARQRARDALTLWLGALGPDDRRVGIAANNLGAADVGLGDYPGAEAAYRRSLELALRLYGETHPSVSDAWGNLAEALRMEGRYDEAVEFNKKALEVRQQTLGPDHPWVAMSLSNYANVESELRHHAAAAKMYREAARIYEKLYGPEHERLIAPWHGLSICQRGESDFAGSLVSSQRAVAIAKKVLPANHPTIAQVNDGVGASLQGLGRLREAEAAFRESATMREGMAADHPDWLGTLTPWGEVLAQQKRYPEAIATFERALRIYRAMPRRDRAKEADVEFSLSKSRWANRDHVRARADAQDAKAVFDELGDARSQELNGWLAAHR